MRDGNDFGFFLLLEGMMKLGIDKLVGDLRFTAD